MKYTLILIGFLISTNCIAQELNATVNIQAARVQTADQAIFTTLQKDLQEFLSLTKWTDKIYAVHEKIDCTFNIDITSEEGVNRFKASIAIQANRPVYNSEYKTLIFYHKDNEFEFEYAQYQPLDFNENAVNSNLTAVIAYYAYVVLGYDFDSFSPSGGTPWFNSAQKIVNTMQNSRYAGWKAFDSKRNRYWIVDNLLSSKFDPLRKSFYSYHRKGLDHMYENDKKARAVILQSVKTIEKNHKEYPNSMAIAVFNNCKSDEIFNIFNHSEVDASEKVQLGNIIVGLDPSKAQKFMDLGSYSKNSSAPTRPASRSVKGRN